MLSAIDWANVLAAGDGALLVFVGLAVAVVVIALTYITLDGKPKLTEPLGAVGWSFTESWASTLTEVGAVLGVLVAAEVVGAEAKPLSAAALGGLNLFFGALVVIAPLLFTAIATTAEPGSEPEGPKYQGFVGVFLISTAITVWAVLGELGALAMLLHELGEGNLSPIVTTLFLVLAGIAAILVGIYAVRTVRAVLTYRIAGATFVDGIETVPARPRRWSLL